MAAIEDCEYRTIQQLYTEDGLAMADIAKKYNVSLNAVIYFMRKHNIPRRTGGQTHHIKWKNAPATFQIREPQTEKDRLLHGMGAMLYWAEGCKTETTNGVDFTNSDPEMVKLFINFLRNRYILNEERLRCCIYLHQNQDSVKLQTYWSTLLNIPGSQFTRPYVAKPRYSNKKRTRQMKYGLVHVRYYDRKLLKDLLSLIESSHSQFCVGGRAVNCTSL